MAYADDVEEIRELWPEGHLIESKKVDRIEFTSRFPRPEWYKEE